MPDSTNNSNDENRKEYIPIIEELIKKKREFSDHLKEILGSVRKSEDSEYKLSTYLNLLDIIPRGLRIDWIIIGDHIVRNLHRLEFSHQKLLLDDIITNVAIFSNKQLAILYNSLTKSMRKVELKAKDEGISTNQLKELKSYRHRIYQEIINKSRIIENTIEDIKIKYFEETGAAIQQLVNKNQFLKDFKLITNNPDKFTREQLEEYFGFIRNGILKYIIKLFSNSEIKFLYSSIEEISRNIRIKNKKNLLKFIATRGDPFYEIKVQEARTKEIKKCNICKKNNTEVEYHPLCKICYYEKIKDFPDKYYPKEVAFKNFSTSFLNAYQNYDKNLGYLIVKIDLPFDSPYTVMDLEATGDITKDRSQFITTMGVLYGNMVQVYQLIDFSKNKKFKKFYQKVVNGFKRPAVAYNFEGSERIWLKIYTGGWIDIQKYEIRFSEELGEYRHSLKLEDISFEWDDISGNDCVEQCELYQTDGDFIHLLLIAYHNFIDLLREYLVGLTDLKVYDYLDGKIWNPLNNELVNRFTCSVCFNDFNTKEQLENHVKFHKKKQIRKRNATRKRKK